MASPVALTITAVRDGVTSKALVIVAISHAEAIEKYLDLIIHRADPNEFEFDELLITACPNPFFAYPLQEPKRDESCKS